MIETPKLDDFSKQFLGEAKSISVQRGQQMSSDKLEKARNQYLLDEACDFGDTLVRYVVAHRKLSIYQRVWGFSLSVFCLRKDYPEGGEAFDELFDKGGEDLEIAVMGEIPESEVEAVQKELPVFTDAQLRKAAVLAETTTGYVEQLKKRKDMSNAQVVYALGRAFHNLRSGLLKEHGGTAAFDLYVERALAYLNEDGESG